VVVSLRESLRKTRLLSGTVKSVSPQDNVVHIATPDGRELAVPYDQLIVSLGSVSRTLPIPGLAEHGVGFKTLPDAIRLRNHVLQTLEIAESLDDEKAREAWLTYVFVGAGYAGLEGLAELQDFACDVLSHYPRCQQHGMRWLLVDAAATVMPEIGSKLAAFAERELRGRGIEVKTGTTLSEAREDHVVLSGDERVPTRTLVWTAGVAPGPISKQLGLPLTEAGRIQVSKEMQVDGHSNIWAIGDIAAVPDPAHPGQPCPPTAQHAMRQGRLVATNVVAALNGSAPKPFTFKTLGVFVDMGQRKAVGLAMGVRLRGVLAWWIARTYHLYLMPGTKRRLRLLVDWNIQLIFGRDVSELGNLRSPPPLGHAHDSTGRADT
jgi:NADH dehydrogenase